MVPTLVLKERKPQGNLVKVWDGLYFNKTSEQHHKDRMKADHKTLLIKKKKNTLGKHEGRQKSSKDGCLKGLIKSPRRK